MAQPSNEITSLIGREIYTISGAYVGEVDDLRLNLDDEQLTALAVTNVNEALFDDLTRGALGVLLPYRWVLSVGDVVLVNDNVKRLHTPEAPASHA